MPQNKEEGEGEGKAVNKGWGGGEDETGNMKGVKISEQEDVED